MSDRVESWLRIAVVCCPASSLRLDLATHPEILPSSFSLKVVGVKFPELTSRRSPTKTRFLWEEGKDNGIECMSPQTRSKLACRSAVWEHGLQHCTPNELPFPVDENSTQAQKSHFTI